MLDKREAILISRNDKYAIYASVLSKDVYDKAIRLIAEYTKRMTANDKKEFVKNLGIKGVDDIITLGDTRDTTEFTTSFLNTIFKPIKVRCMAGYIYSSYPCYHLSDWDKDIPYRNLPIHQDSKSSWNCIVARLMKPTYIIIYKTINI